MLHAILFISMGVIFMKHNVPSREAFMLQAYYDRLQLVAELRQCGDYASALWHLRHATTLRLRNTVAWVHHWRCALAT